MDRVEGRSFNKGERVYLAQGEGHKLVGRESIAFDKLSSPGRVYPI